MRSTLVIGSKDGVEERQLMLRSVVHVGYNDPQVTMRLGWTQSGMLNSYLLSVRSSGFYLYFLPHLHSLVTA
jgi:hypothetical protein